MNDIAVPRHYVAEQLNNRIVRDYIESKFHDLGLRVWRQGKCHNILASRASGLENTRVIIGAHYDSVPGSPGADDNGSAIATLLGVAETINALQLSGVAFVAFNREEDNLAGSREFVSWMAGIGAANVELVHVLEMTGYARETPGTQQSPQGIPLDLGNTGDFIGLLANSRSGHVVEDVLDIRSVYVPRLPVKALKLFKAEERLFPHLLRSDHTPFWDAGIQALLWTDTAELRNPNYHKSGDVPETLDYEFLHRVTVLLAHSVYFTLVEKAV
ncbi:MAG: M28 family peptidase [Fibrobacteria bacterium]|nr:M28 family peptidase [Fibrobacteria bacterium]